MSDKDLQRVTESLSYIGQALRLTEKASQSQPNHRPRQLALTADTLLLYHGLKSPTGFSKGGVESWSFGISVIVLAA